MPSKNPRKTSLARFYIYIPTSFCFYCSVKGKYERTARNLSITVWGPSKVHKFFTTIPRRRSQPHLNPIKQPSEAKQKANEIMSMCPQQHHLHCICQSTLGIRIHKLEVLHDVIQRIMNLLLQASCNLSIIIILVKLMKLFIGPVERVYHICVMHRPTISNNGSFFPLKAMNTKDKYSNITLLFQF